MNRAMFELSSDLVFQKLGDDGVKFYRSEEVTKNMTSILSRLTRPVIKWMEYGSYLDILRNQERYLRLLTGNHTAKYTHHQPVYKTRLALPEDYDKVMTFMSDAFFKDDPIMGSIGLEEQEPAPSLLKLMYDHLRDGMTIIAEGQDNCIVGVAVNAGSCPWDPDKFVEFARCCECGSTRDVIEFEAYVTRKPNLWERYCVLKIFECSYLAVGPDFRNRGIARKLVLDSWYLARDCGYRLFRVDCSNRYIARIAEGFGWKRICTIPFNQYLKDGKLVFKYIKEPHTEMLVYIDQVTFCKDYCPPYNSCKTTSAPKILKEKT